jgi:hypothetical protein
MLKEMELEQKCSLLFLRFYAVPVGATLLVTHIHPSTLYAMGYLQQHHHKKGAIQAVLCLCKTILNLYSRKEFSIRHVLGYQVSVFVRFKYTIHDV